MSDFLSKLVMRDVGLADVLRPRLASLFEPPADTGTLDLAIADERADVEERVDTSPPKTDARVAPLEPLAPREPPARRDVVPAAPESPRERASRVEDAASVGAARPPETPQAAPVGAARPEPVEAPPRVDVQIHRAVVPAAEVPGPPSPAPPNVPVASTSRAAPRPIEPHAPARPSEAPSRPAAPVPAVSAPAPAPPAVGPFPTEAVIRASVVVAPAGRILVRDETVADEIAPDVRPSAPPTTSPVAALAPSTLRALPAATIVVQPRVAPYAEPARPPRAAAAPAPEPTIHVTIGRVEVRATPPAAPASRIDRRAPDVMRLEEYLRRRAGGRGR